MEKRVTVRATNKETGDVTFWHVPEYRAMRHALERSVDYWGVGYSKVEVEYCPGI